MPSTVTVAGIFWRPHLIFPPCAQPLKQYLVCCLPSARIHVNAARGTFLAHVHIISAGGKAVCWHAHSNESRVYVWVCVCACLPALAACRADTIMVVVGWPETKDCEEVGESRVPWGVVITRPATEREREGRESTVSTTHVRLGVCWHASHAWIICLW